VLFSIWYLERAVFAALFTVNLHYLDSSHSSFIFNKGISECESPPPHSSLDLFGILFFSLVLFCGVLFHWNLKPISMIG